MLKTMGENPALEWNTAETLSNTSGTAGGGAKPAVDEVFLMPLLVKFDLQVGQSTSMYKVRTFMGLCLPRK